ncbi:methyl-accepting chemotaxis protein, partial [Pseudomonas otitidis]
PMLVTSFYLVRDVYDEFHATGVELQGLGPLAGALTLRSDLETLGNLLQINALLGQSGQAGDVEQRIGALEDKVAAGLEAIPTSD